MNKINMTQTALSKSVGWPESTGRTWIKKFEEYIPFEIIDGKKLFNDESQNVITIIKKISEKGYKSSEIKSIFDERGVLTEKSVKLLKDKTIKEFVVYNQNVLNTLPSQKELTLAILQVIKDKNVYTGSMINDSVAEYLKLTDEQINMRYEEGKEYVYVTRMRSARFSLKKQEYIEEVSKFTYQITENGLELLDDDVHNIDNEISELENVKDPLDTIKEKVNEIEQELIEELIEQLKKANWRRLEFIVVELLSAMGYGEGEVTQKSNDGGLDGIIKEDKLGLDNIYIQAKRWANTVTRPDVMGFSGALDGGTGARKGIFITTSQFSDGAYKYVASLENKKIILIDGEKLARLMIEYNIGVDIKQKIIIKEVDLSYFEGE